MTQFAAGIAAGIAVGVGIGLPLGVAAVHNKLKRLLAEGRIHAKDPDGNSLSGADLVSLLSGKPRKKT